jgi:hypothetical protein
MTMTQFKLKAGYFADGGIFYANDETEGNNGVMFDASHLVANDHDIMGAMAALALFAESFPQCVEPDYKVLLHETCIRLASWRNSFAKVGTIESYLAGKPELQTLCRNRGDDEVWASYTGATITTDKAFYRNHALTVEAATVVADNQIVSVDSKLYRVSVVPGNAGESPRNSDPIHFIPV